MDPDIATGYFTYSTNIDVSNLFMYLLLSQVIYNLLKSARATKEEQKIKLLKFVLLITAESLITL